MRGIAEALAGFPRAHPAVFETGHATFVELDGAFGALQPFRYSRVDSNQSRKG